MNECKVKSVNGPVVTVEGDIALSMQDMVLVGYQRLIGEVVGLQDKQATVQVYESTTGLAPGHPVVPTGAPMQIELGPGLLRGIFDGIARPLKAIAEASGAVLPAVTDGAKEPAGAFPLGFRPSVDHVADAVAYLLEAPALTGQILHVDGGQHLAP